MIVRAVIDVGTNSVKVLVAHVDGTRVVPLIETSRQTRLGRGFYTTRELQPSAVAETASVVAEYCQLAREKGAERVEVVATSVVREARNALDLQKVLAGMTGRELRILSGDEEAELAYRGVMTGQADLCEALLITDVGGGSTEFVLGRGKHVDFHRSIPLGTVRMVEAFQIGDPPGTHERRRCHEHVDRLLDEVVLDLKRHLGDGAMRLIGTGGTCTLMARIHLSLANYDRQRIEGTPLELSVIAEMVDRLWSLSESQRRQIIGLPKEKIDVILMGALIYFRLIERFSLEGMTISLRGLRYGVLTAGA